MSYVLPFSEVGIDNVPQVGGKNASLGEMLSKLTSAGIKVPNGYATTSEAYRYFIEYNKLYDRIDEFVDNVQSLEVTGKQIRSWIMHGEMPQDFADEIVAAYEQLEQEYGPYPDVAVRSSATAEDLAHASFAGQQETFLNISGRRNLLITCKRVFASLFTDRAISYREHNNFKHMDVALSVGIQKMVRAENGASGVMFTLDTESGFPDVVFINASYGLGENVVQGAVNPDEFYVFKKTLKGDKRPIIRRHLGEKAIKMVYAHDSTAGLSTRNVKVNKEERHQFCINDDEVLQLARYAISIEQHYGRAMDIEWAKDGETGELFILQARPETVQAALLGKPQESFKLEKRGEILAIGKSVGKRIASGKTCVILDASDMHQLEEGDVLVTDITDPDWEPVMKKSAAIVTNRGGRTCHAAIIAREFGIPAIVGCGDATNAINTGTTVTVSCAEGDTGYVYDGELPYRKETIDISSLQKPATRIMLNLANPELAFETSALPVDGVGLARLEFIINNTIRVHPRALIDYPELDKKLRKKIAKISAGYPDPVSFYVKRLAEGIGTIAAAFYPRQVIVRMSDFKSNEYACLIGGELYEPQEENPMIGFRGAYRYPSEEFRQCFSLECQALLRVRERMGLDNVDVMIPFVRSVDEGLRVLELMADHRLKRGEHGLKVYLMCEIPANALLAEKFLEHFDGFSIGSNDLTQLTLGVDRDSGQMAIDACRKQGKYVGICGQAPSDFPEVTRWLVQQGISSISLNPDSVVDMTREVLQVESQFKN